MPTIAWTLIAIVVIVALWAIMTYNRFITLRNRSDEAWSDVEVQMKRRYNLIPNLVETVKAYAKHEASTFEKVTAARNSAMKATTLEEHAKSENMLSQTLKSLFAVSEAYPDLKANQNFLQLQDELRDAEDKIQASWRFYNSNVRDYNTKLQHFPPNLIGNLFRFQEKEFFELTEAEAAVVKEVPKVKFS
ncbi:LemA family protein [Candidatus Uhrbacteria bacterium]|nr:LemA family protein [Candidatus Uhrbacteria bacterium]